MNDGPLSDKPLVDVSLVKPIEQEAVEVPVEVIQPVEVIEPVPVESVPVQPVETYPYL